MEEWEIYDATDLTDVDEIQKSIDRLTYLLRKEMLDEERRESIESVRQMLVEQKMGIEDLYQ